MIGLKVGLPRTDLSKQVGLPVFSVSKICTAWNRFIYFEVNKLCQMPEWDRYLTVKQFSQFPHLQIVLDCIKIFCTKPSSLKTNKVVFGNDKRHTTFKYLVGTTPHPAVVCFEGMPPACLAGQVHNGGDRPWR